MNNIWDELLNTLYTKDQAAEFVAQIDSVINNLYTKTKTLEQVLHEMVSMERKDLMLKVLLPQTDVSERQKVLSDLKATVQSIPVLELEISFSPTGKSVQSMYLWMQQHIRRKVLLHLRVNPSLVGGAIIKYKGLYKDYSLRRQIEISKAEKITAPTAPVLKNATPLPKKQ